MKKLIRVLIVEDCKDDALLIVNKLRNGGYNPVYEQVKTPAAVKRALRKNKWDCIISDYSMPLYEGPAKLFDSQQSSIDIPIIKVSATMGDNTSKLKMKTSAYDYISKDNLAGLIPLLKRKLRQVKLRRKQKQGDGMGRQQTQIINQCLDAVITTDLDGNITSWNDGMEKLTGRQKQEAIGKHISCFNPEKKLIPFQNQVIAPLMKNGFHVVELRIYKKLGEYTYVRLSLSLSRDKMCTPTGIIGSPIDITRCRQASESLGADARIQQLALQVGHIGAFEVDLESGRGAWTPALARIWGIPANFAGDFASFCWERVHPEDLTRVKKEFEQLAQNFEGDAMEFRIIRPDGEMRWILWQGQVIRDAVKGCSRVVGVNLDITDHKLVEKALKESECAKSELLEKLNEAQHIAMIGSWEWNLLTNQVWWSDETYRIFGVTQQDFVPSFDANGKFIHPDDFEKYRNSFEHSLETGEPLDLDIRLVVNNGALKYCQAKGKVIYDDSSRPFRFIGTVMDISSRKRAEEILRANSSYNRRLIEASIDPLVSIGSDGKITDVNEATETVIGVSRERLIGNDFLNYFTEPEKAREGYQKVLAEGLVRDYPLTIRHTSGKTTDVLYNATVYKNEAGEIQGVFAAARDITERKKVEENLSTAHNLLRQVFQSLDQAVLVVDSLTSKIIMCNSAVEQVFGYQEDEILSNAIDRLQINSKWGKKFGQALSYALDQSGRFHIEYRMRRKNGTNLDAEVTATEIKDHPRGRIGIVFVIRDITERKHIEEALQMAENKYRSIFENAVEGIFQSTLSGKFITVNPAMARMLGYESPKELITKITDIEQQLYVDPKKRQELTRRLEGHDVVERFVSQLYRKDGKKIWISENGRAVRDGSGIIQYYEGIAEDITEMKQLEYQFLRAQRLESIGALAGGIAHDLNNILAPILLGIELVRRKVADESAMGVLNTMESSAKRGSDLIHQILSFARGVEGERIIVQLRHLINDIEKVIRETFPKTITLHLDLIKELWRIMADATQLHQVLMNICVNARDAMPQGGTIEIKAENIFLDEHYSKMNSEAKKGAYVVLSVTDTGAGISDEVIDKIFEPFFTTKEVGKGTGLGLSTVNAIVRAHSGFINVQSKVGKGTTFKIFLPALTTLESEKAVSQVTTKPLGNGELVLVVDDEAAVREITRAMLEAYNYHVLTANDGAEAIVVFEKHKNEVAAVITDMIMPLMDGTATIHALKKIDPIVKIIVSSGKSANGDSARIPDVSVSAFLTKPFTSEKLLKVLHEVICCGSDSILTQ
jgi:PAS domain S-box-containing protein